MADNTVFEMEIEGTVHPVEDRTARGGLEALEANIEAINLELDSIKNAVQTLTASGSYSLPASAANTQVISATESFFVRVLTVGKLRILTGAMLFVEDGQKINLRVFTIPEGYRPKSSVEGSLYCSTGNQSTRFWVEENGNAMVYTSAANAGGYAFINAVYEVA